jgi:hypothetical protein
LGKCWSIGNKLFFEALKNSVQNESVAVSQLPLLVNSRKPLAVTITALVSSRKYSWPGHEWLSTNYLRRHPVDMGMQQYFVLTSFAI